MAGGAWRASLQAQIGKIGDKNMNAEQFKARRLAQGYKSHAALAAAIGKDRVTIWRYENGKTEIPKTVAMAMASIPPADPGKEK